MIEIKITCNTVEEALKEMRGFNHETVTVTSEGVNLVPPKKEAKKETSKKVVEPKTGDVTDGDVVTKDPEPEPEKQEKPKANKRRSGRRRRTKAEIAADKLLAEGRNENPEGLANDLLETIRNDGGQEGLLKARGVISAALDMQGGNYDGVRLKYVDDIRIHGVVSEFEEIVRQIGSGKVEGTKAEVGDETEESDDDDDIFGED